MGNKKSTLLSNTDSWKFDTSFTCYSYDYMSDISVSLHQSYLMINVDNGKQVMIEYASINKFRYYYNDQKLEFHNNDGTTCVFGRVTKANYESIYKACEELAAILKSL